jgi:hypothetical protein
MILLCISEALKLSRKYRCHPVIVYGCFFRILVVSEIFVNKPKTPFCFELLSMFWAFSSVDEKSVTEFISVSYGITVILCSVIPIHFYSPPLWISNGIDRVVSHDKTIISDPDPD